MNKKTQNAFERYGEVQCRRAWEMCYVEGYGAHSIAIEGPDTIWTTRQADAAINAWEDYLDTGYGT
jgi:hypothetical protein